MISEKYFPSNQKSLKESGIELDKSYTPEVKEVGRRVIRTLMNEKFSEAYYTGPKNIDEFEETFRQELKQEIGKVAKFEYKEKETINLKRLSEIIEKSGFIATGVQMKERDGKILYEIKGYEKGKIVPKLMKIVDKMFPESTGSIERIVSSQEANELLYQGARKKIIREKIEKRGD